MTQISYKRVYPVRQLPEQTPRIENGPIRFGDDWCGVFLRGDTAAHYAKIFREMRIVSKPHIATVLCNLIELLEASDERKGLQGAEKEENK